MNSPPRSSKPRRTRGGASAAGSDGAASQLSPSSREADPTAFGRYIRSRREARCESDPAFSLRQLAGRVGVEPSYLSKVERGREPAPSEDKVRRLAQELGENPDVLLAMAGRVSAELQRIIRQRPELFAELLRQLATAPDHAILRVVREVRDGEW